MTYPELCAGGAAWVFSFCFSAAGFFHALHNGETKYQIAMAAVWGFFAWPFIIISVQYQAIRKDTEAKK